MTIKSKKAGKTTENKAAAATDARRANAAGLLDDSAADVDEEEVDTPEESVDGDDGAESVEDASRADAAGDDELEGTTSSDGTRNETNDTGERDDEEMANIGGNDDGGDTVDNDEDDGQSTAIDDDATDEAEEEQADELWDLKVVLPAKQILMPRPKLCQGDDCNLVACCIWSSNHDPESPWYSCLDCQDEFFGGWPENPGEIPIKVMGDDLRNAMLDKCTAYADPPMPNLPSIMGIGYVDGATCARVVKPSDDAVVAVPNVDGSGEGDESPYDDDDDQGSGVIWDLTKIYNAKELKRAKPTMCSAENCDLVACSRWESTENGKWYSCLDCQER